MLVIKKPLFIYGLAAAGKSYLGDLLSCESGLAHIELDPLLPKTMIDKIEAGELGGFTVEERKFYVEQRILPAIRQALADQGLAIFSQAAYTFEFRELIAGHFPELIFIELSAPSDLRRERSLARGDSVGKRKFIEGSEERWQPAEEGRVIKIEILRDKSDKELVAEIASSLKPKLLNLVK